ncbi:S8 family serine peptidase [Sporosarcina sp. GW1-11]|uniref:S8 family serine peptidase n=1 Tax=Sporosarcina sp. GW1-11 TaxID=2899126 RepID=UPI0029548B42|nr:S8 family serine peptidase [Sporosarcina sp. GW1-11]
MLVPEEAVVILAEENVLTDQYDSHVVWILRKHTPQGDKVILPATNFSNYGRALDLVALGELILSLLANGEVMYGSGTSMATPYAAAPEMNKDRVRTLLLEYHVDLGQESYDLEYGWGMLDTVKVLQSLH